jgi:tyrosine-protein phosphatase SIW14
MPSSTQRLWISGVLWICALLGTAPISPSHSWRAQGKAADSPVSNASAQPAQKLDLAGLPNAGKVNELLYRGGRPDAAGLAKLKELGVTLVIDFDNSGGREKERTAVEGLGMRYVNIPLSGWYSPPSESVARFLELVHANQARRIFVHCRYGSDRTGVMMAVYRISQQKWTAEQALLEMHLFQFHSHWHPNLSRYVRRFPDLYAADPAFAALR